MCYWVIPVSGIPMTDTTVQHVTQEDQHNTEIGAKIDKFKALWTQCDNINFKFSNFTGFTLHDITNFFQVDLAYGDNQMELVEWNNKE